MLNNNTLTLDNGGSSSFTQVDIIGRELKVAFFLDLGQLTVRKVGCFSPFWLLPRSILYFFIFISKAFSHDY